MNIARRGSTRSAVAAMAVLALLVTALVTESASRPAQAFKPWTHEVSATALADATDDGMITIQGREYPVRPAVVTALRRWPDYYRGGVIGPDGFPDLVYGQSQIHPVDTGKWLEYVLRKAWAAQQDRRYSVDQKQQILAFAYGYLTHAAGDVWAHTLVNDFAQGVFPGFEDVISDIDAAEVALRHIIIEGYIGDATSGYDGSGRWRQLNDGDYSDDGTPALPINAPMSWLSRTLVSPSTSLPVGSCRDRRDDDGDGLVNDGCPNGPPSRGTPEPQRGAMIDFFLDLQAQLEKRLAAIRFDIATTNCAGGSCGRVSTRLPVRTVRGLDSVRVSWKQCQKRRCRAQAADALLDRTFTKLQRNYVRNWIADIVSGLDAWPELGLKSSRALFDPQARRDAQNYLCESYGSETQVQRRECELGVSATDTLFLAIDPFVNDHLLSMIGLPDVVGKIRTFLDKLTRFVNKVLGPALNPFRAARDVIKTKLKEFLNDAIRETFGIDVEVLSSFVKHPTYWLNVERTTLYVGGREQSVDLFASGEHSRIDNLLNLPADHHTGDYITLPDGSQVQTSALADGVSFKVMHAFDDASTMSKLLLLDGPRLNRVAGDLLVASGDIRSADAVRTYTDQRSRPANVMVDALDNPRSALVNDTPWLKSIDTDHGWRADGLPRFAPGESGHGGTGKFPLWESCLLRPAFRTLFVDWETDPSQWPRLGDYRSDAANFPSLGDATGGDRSDVRRPNVSVGLGGPTYASNGTRWLGEGATVRATPRDAVFMPEEVHARLQVALESTRKPWTRSSDGSSIQVTGPSGSYVVTTRSTDPCNNWQQAGQSRFMLDRVGPEITIASPAAGRVADTDDVVVFRWRVREPRSFDSGVASATNSFDGEAIRNGAPVDAFFLDPGAHQLLIRGVDRVGNEAVDSRTLTVRATAASLVSNVDRAAGSLISDGQLADRLRSILVGARNDHAAGRHDRELNRLTRARDLVQRHSGDGVRPPFAARFVAWVDDLIAHH